MGAKAKRGSEGIGSVLRKLAGPLGFAAVVTAVAMAAGKIAKFFDEIKRRADEAVREVQQLRAAYDDLYEALGAYDEKSRETITKTTTRLFQEVGVTPEVGLPVVNAYARQFKSLVDIGQLAQEDYTRGLKEMLGYA